MPTLFTRVFEGRDIVETINDVREGCEWVLNGEGVATIKWDGTCCLIQDGKLYKRFDYKKGRKLPEGAIPCQEEPDSITGHFPHWVLCKEDNIDDKYFIDAFKKYIATCKRDGVSVENGTYELVGLHFNNNPYGLDYDTFIKHGKDIIEVGRSYNEIKNYLHDNYIEGIVFHRGNGEMCKIKRSDFGYKWNNYPEDRICKELLKRIDTEVNDAELKATLKLWVKGYAIKTKRIDTLNSRSLK